MGLRALLTILVFLCAFVSTGVLASSLESRELGLADVPACGLQCIFLKAGASGCRLDDLNCVCTNQALAASLAECMLSNCTMADTQTTARVQAQMCHLSDQSKQSHVFLITVIVYSLAFLLVALRIAGKLVSKRLSIDDWIVLTALLLGGVPLGCVLQMTSLGFGQHLWNLEDGKLLPILRLFLIASSTYVIVLALIKISLILFYLEIFTTPRFRVTAYVILGYISINSLIIFLLTIFSCRPVQSFWNRDIKGKCLDVQALAYANSASAIIQDVILLILPLVFIRKLQMKRYKKVAVGLMFSIGAFGCIATVVRLHTLLQFKISIDPTWDYAPATIWTVLELAAGFACVSLPSIRILLVFILPKRVKEMFSLFTHTSGNRSSPTPDPREQQGRQWKKPSSWMSLSRDLHDSGHGGSKQDSFMNRIWSVHSSVPSTHKHMRHGSRRLESAMSNYSESAVAVTHPPYQESRRERNDRILRKIEQVELLKVPGKSKKRQSERPSLKSNVSRDSQLTALPPIGRIGCLPEGSFSDLDIRRDFRGRDRRHVPDDHV